MRQLFRILTVCVDYCLLIVSIFLVLWSRIPRELFSLLIYRHLVVFVILFLGWMFVFFLFNIYTFYFPLRMTRLFVAIMINVLWSSLVFYLFPIFDLTPKTNLVLVGTLATILIFMWHRIVDYIFIVVLKSHEIMIAVSDYDSLSLLKMLQENSRHKYTVVGVLANASYYKFVEEIFNSEKIFTDIQSFERAIKRSSVQTIICADWWFSQLYISVYEMFPQKIRMFHAISFYEKVFSYIPVYSTNEYWIMSNMDVVSRRSYEIIKRILDLLFSVIVFPIVALLCLCVAIFIRFWGGKGSVFFTQERVGHNNKLFTLIKFRTMNIDAEKNGAQWAQEDDPRVTKLGRFLRITRLDELPQIINVIKGDMSFIGPRPERMVFVEQLAKKIPHYHIRHIIKPGISGWAQINYKYTSSVEDAVKKVSYDIFYVKRMNIFLDLYIFFKTIITIFTARGQ